MKYKIERTEKKVTQAGKEFIKATLKDEQAQVLEDVLIWSDFPDFEHISPGVEAEGLIRTSARGFKNLKPSNFPFPKVAMPEGAVSKAESSSDKSAALYENREMAIHAAQDRKYESIAYFNATNSAISLISAMKGKFSNPLNRTVVKQEIEYWREWFLNQWRGRGTNFNS